MCINIEIYIIIIINYNHIYRNFEYHYVAIANYDIKENIKVKIVFHERVQAKNAIFLHFDYFSS